MATGTSYRTPGTLPLQTSGFVGRAAELARTRELLQGARLITITGPGGVGKTRLAVRAADDAADDYRDGVHFIELSAVRDPELLAYTLAAGFMIAECPVAESDDHGTQLDRLLGYLRERELLLIFDTCEHIVDACAALADTVLREAPGVTILATSRQPLDAAGEAVQLLCPLPVPDAGSATAGKADAVELFTQRAAAAVPGFTVTPANLADVVTVCRRLDGIPLAIELAAVRLRALPLQKMADPIGDRLRLLTGGRRSGTARHQTLRAAIEWSYDLCTPAEQLLWARLSVFAGGFGFKAAEGICAGGKLSAEEIVPTLVALVDKSLLVRDSMPEAGPAGSDSLPTFRMLDTIREFGAERLHLADTRVVARWRQDAATPADGEGTRISRAEAAVRGRFIAHYLAAAEEFERDPVANQLSKLRRLSREHLNLRAAFEYALDLPGNDSAAIVLATSLCMYWQITSQLRVGEYWLDQVFGRCPKRSVARARVLAVRGYLRVQLGDYANGTADARAAIAMAAPFSDLATAGRAYNALYFAHTTRKNLAEAQAAAAAAAECYASVGDVHGLARLALIDATLRLQTGELDQCYESATRGLDQLPEDEVWCSAYLYGVQSLVLFLHGDIEGAKSSGMLALMMKQRIDDQIGMAYGLSSLAFMAAGEGRTERAAWLFGAAAPLWLQTGRWYLGDPALEALHQVAEGIARGGLGDERYWELRAAGSSAPLGHAVERALADADTLSTPAAHP